MKKVRIGHIGIHEKANLNSGDTLLFQVVRDIFESILDIQIEWSLYQVWEEFDEKTIDQINKENDALVLGGGGLLLKDQKGSDISNSGWQWNCSPTNTYEIKIPFFVFAIGYNRFYNQDDFDLNFVDSINAITSISPFFGLRNNGSINAVKKYLLDENQQKSKIYRQFCPTTMVSLIYPDLKELADNHAKKESRVLSFNAAFDRTDMRFSNPDKIFNEICKLIKHAEDKGWTIIACSHKEMDREIEGFLTKNNVNYKIKNLTSSSPKEIMEHYAQVDLSVGMRGHSQMIPFGFNKFIISLVSHDKLQFFLDDLELSEFGINLNSHNLLDQFINILHNIEVNQNQVLDSLISKQRFIWKETLGNFSLMEDIMDIS
jgi:polysaccharide pyruvyl transferase WcaK-like protein|tara:strand:+ start:388 stop:1509 length:1122 start_codon:yes stop_codon:yes gene_type:complete